MGVDLSVLGPLTVSVDGTDATPTAPKERMLLALLALRSGEVVSDEQLIDDVWPELDAVRGRHVLQVRVAALRKRFRTAGAGAVIRNAASGYVLESTTGQLDARLFERALGQAHEMSSAGDHEAMADLLREALGLWRGDALVDVDRCLTLEAEAARLRELRAGALEDRIAADLACGRHRSVVAELEGLVAVYPYRERLWELTALAMYRSARQADALRVLEKARNTLLDDLGLDPGPGLRNMEQAILEQHSTLDAPTNFRPGTDLPPILAQARTEPLVSRQRELATLWQLWDRARSGSEPVLAIVQGEAGIGKTRLVAEMAASAGAQGALVLAGRCDEDPLASYQPFREAFRGAGSAVLADPLRSLAPLDRAELGRLEPTLISGAPDDLAGDGDRLLLFEAVAALLRSLGELAPVLFIIEDLHWADRSTRRLLCHLMNHHASGALLLIATTRPDGPSRELMEFMRNPDRTSLVDVGALDVAEIGELIDALMADGSPRDLAQSVHHASGGNPLFAREIVRHLRDHGPLSITRVLGVPPQLEAIILERTTRLAPETVRALTIASVLGQSFTLDLLGAVGEREPLELIDTLEPAITAGFVTETGPDCFAFGHAVVRDALHRSILDSKRMRLHASAAAHIEVHCPDDLAAAADHLLEAGPHVDPGHLLIVLVGAADQAFARVAYDEAAAFLELAVGAGTRAGRSAADLARLRLQWGIAREAAGEPDGKDAIWSAAIEARDAGEPGLFAEGALAFARMPLAVTSADPLTVDLLDQALQALGDSEVPIRARVASRLAYELFWEPGDRRERLARESLELARRIGDAATLAAVLADRRYDAGWNDLEQWLSESRAILRLATVANDRELMWQGGYCCVNSLAMLGRFDDALADLALLAEAADALRRPRMRWWTTVAAASMQIARGAFSEGERLAHEAWAIGERAGDPDATPILLLQAYTLSYLGGRLDEVVDQIGSYAEENPLSVIARIGHTHALAHCGRIDEARTALEEFGLDSFANVPLNINWYANVALLAEVAAFTHDRDSAAALVTLIAPHRALTIDVGASSSFLGPMARYLGLAMATIGDLDGAGAVLQEAIELADKSGTPPWAALTRTDLANVLRARGGSNDGLHASELEGVAATEARRLDMGDLSSRSRPRFSPD